MRSIASVGDGELVHTASILLEYASIRITENWPA